MTESLFKIIDLDVATLRELEEAVYYRRQDGSTERIAHRDRVCPACCNTTRIVTEHGAWASFTRLHLRAHGLP